MNTLQLIAPAQTDIVDPRIERNPSKLKIWLESLPYANPRAALEMLYEALNGCNRQMIDPGTRIALLEHYHNAASALLEGIKDPTNTQRISEKQFIINGLMRQLINEMGLGYKTILLDVEPEIGTRKIHNTFTTALHATMHYLSLSMLRAYQTYEPPPPNAWRELNHLYQHAQDLHLKDYVGDKYLQLPDCNTISKVYMRALLLGISDPYHMPANNIVHTWELIPRISEYTYTISLNEAAGGSGQFYVDLNSDFGAAPLDANKMESLDHTSTLVLCTNLLVDNLTSTRESLQLEMADDDTFKPFPSLKNNLAFYDHLLQFWWEKPERRYTREEQLTWMRVAFGISASHHFIHSAVETPPQITDNTEDDNIELSGLHIGTSPNNSSGSYAVIRCQLNDHSKGGFALTLPNNSQARLRVGEILAIQPSGANNDKKWHIGVVRWFSQCSDYETKIGVQHLSSSPQAVMIGGIDESNSRNTGIMLNDGKQSERERRIIASPGTFDKERELKLDIAHETMQARADRLIESSAAFDLFTCLLR